MELPINLQNKIIDFLKSLPNIDDTKSRRAFIYSVGLDSQLQDQIPFDESPAQFVPLLLSKILRYGTLNDGRNPLEALLEATKSYVGQDKKTYCETLIQKVCTHTLATTVVTLISQNDESNRKKEVQELYPALEAYLSNKPSVRDAFADLKKMPDDPDAQTALRLQLKKLLAEDDAFAIQLQNILKKAVKKENNSTVISQTAGDNAKQIGQVYGNVTFGKE